MSIHTDTFFDLDAAHMSVSRVTLKVRNLDEMVTFYQRLLSLTVHHETAGSVVLGAEAGFLELIGDPDAALANLKAPGLFHVAFLLPRREDLSSWLGHIDQQGIALQGASDHAVSEAVYLSDPEGNGIEVYADRPVETWRETKDGLYIPSHRLDFSTLPTPEKWTGIPEKTRVGHVHVQTTDIAAAESFWTGLNMDVMARYPGGSFFGAGGYHHQVAANVWRSLGQPVEPGPKTGLSSIAFRADPALFPEPETRVAPSGIEVILHPKRS
ncbi:MAG: VOC family protein [Pseudomonadota bacterium]